MSTGGTTLPVEDVSPQMPGCPGSQPRAKALREDPLKILDPARKKLSSLETQRIAGVVEDCISKVETVALLPAVLTHLDDVPSRLGEEFTAALKEHHHLGEKLACLEPRSAWGLEGQAWEAKARERAHLEKSFQSSLRNVLRLLRANPVAARILKGQAGAVEGHLKAERGSSLQGLVGALRELHGVLLEKLLTSPAEERERIRYMREVTLRHGNNMEMVATLETEVAAAIKDRDTEIAEKNEVIRKLKSSLHQMEKISEDFVLRTQQDAEKHTQSDAKNSEGKRTRLKQEINHLKVQLNSLLTENREVETALRKKKYKVETEIENWIQKYDADMGEKQLELEEMAAIYEEEKAELKELEEAYAVLEVEFSQIKEERRLAQEKKEKQARDFEARSKAATIIQAGYRGFRVRKAMKAKGKPKKGKKGKGKKGK